MKKNIADMNVFEYYSQPENQIIDIKKTNEELKNVLLAKGWHTTPDADMLLLKALELWIWRNYDGVIPYSEIPDNVDAIKMPFHFARIHEDVTRPTLDGPKPMLKENPMDLIYHLALAN